VSSILNARNKRITNRSTRFATAARLLSGELKRYKATIMRIFYIFTLLVLTGCGDISKSLEEGYAYGQSHTLGQCFNESMSRLDACVDNSCVIENIGFPRGCAKTALLDPSFCATVPSETLAAAEVMKKQCSTHKFPKACYKYMQQSVARCLNENSL